MAKIWRIDAAQPDQAVIAKAVEMIRQGGVVVMPTRGLYGLGADAFCETAIQQIYRIKGRPTTKALLILIEDMDSLVRVTLPVHAMAKHLMHRFWPGKVTFVLPAHPDLPMMLTAGGAKIGVRLVAHPVAAALVRTVGRPLTGTSANISGAGGCASVDQIDADLLKGVDGVLDAGLLAGGPGSTVVDVTGSDPKILREGAVSTKEIVAGVASFGTDDAPLI